MDTSVMVMWVGFVLAAYSVVGNDVIQTLGTFLTSNENKQKWYILFGFASIILTYALINGYINNDIDYGRLDKFEVPGHYSWYYLLPPLILLVITRMGIPVSTTFMILTLFSLQAIPNNLSEMTASIFDSDTKLGGMVQKSIMGYIIAFITGIVAYITVLNVLEKYLIKSEIKESRKPFWTVAQWFSTGFLWFQWLTQDLANIFIFLNGGNNLTMIEFVISLLIINGLLCYIFYIKGGAVQDVVRSKTNTEDIRSATFIDLIYGVILYVFKEDYFGLWGGKLPMSTTWVFVGLLAGREIGIEIAKNWRLSGNTFKVVMADLGKIFFGLLVSIILVFAIKMLAN